MDAFCPVVTARGRHLRRLPESYPAWLAGEARDRLSAFRGPAVREASLINPTDALMLEGFLERLRSALKDRSFRPLPVRERMIPKADGKKRRLGIATVTA